MKKIALLLATSLIAAACSAQIPPTTTSSTSGGPSPVTVVVAAYDSVASAKASANYVCTGTNDQNTINTAIGSLPSGGGTVLLRVGTYKTSGSVTWDRSYVDLEGEGHPMWGSFLRGWISTSSPAGAIGTNCAHIAAQSTGFNVVEIDSANLPDNGENRHRGNRVAHLYITGSAYSSIGISTGTGWSITALDGAGMDNCSFEDNFIQQVSVGMSLSLDSGLIRANCIEDCATDCLQISGYGSRAFENTLFDCGGNGVSAFSGPIGGAAFNISNNEIGDVVNGVYLDGVNFCIVNSNIFNDGSTAMTVGVLATGGTGHTINGNNFGYPGAGSATAPKTAVQVGASGLPTTATTVNGNSIFGSSSVTPQYAIAFWQGTGTATGNSISGSYSLNGSTGKTILAPSGSQIFGNFGDNNLAPIGGPAVTTPPIAWFHADALSLSNGANVTAWADSSGHAMTATPSGTPPTFATGAVNGLPAVTFSGTSNELTTPTPQTFAQPWTMYVVAKSTSVSSGDTPCSCSTSSMYLDASNRLAIFAGTFTAGIGPTITPTNWNVYEACFNGASSYVDTNGTGNQTTLSQGSAVLGTTGYWIGAQWTGQVAEIIIYPASLSSGDRATIRQYLEAKYGISGS